MESKQDIVTSISEALPEPPTDREIINAIVEGIQRFTGASIIPGRLNEEEQATAYALYQSRYSQSEWNLGTIYPEYNSR